MKGSPSLIAFALLATAGVVSIHFVSLSIEFLFVLLALAAIPAFLLYRLCMLSYFQTFAIYLSIFLLGVVWSKTIFEKSLSNQINSHKIAYAAVVLTQSINKEKVIQFDASIVSGDYIGKKIKVSLIKDVENRCEDIDVGNTLVVNSALSELNVNDSIYGRYNMYLLSQGYNATAFIGPSHWQKINLSNFNLPFSQRATLRANLIQRELINILKRFGLSADVYGLTSAMLLGNRSNLQIQTRSMFNDAGVAHVLALSGMHIGIIFMFLMSVLYVKRLPLLSNFFILLFVWSYVFIVGLPISAQRSAIMLTVYLLTTMLDYENHPLNSLGIAGLILTLVSPLCVLDIGFQLSFLSVLSILICYKPLIRIVPAKKSNMLDRLWHWLWGLAVITISAQVGTMPLLIYYFHSVSLVSIFSNIVAVPATYVIILLSSMMLLFSPICFISEILAVALSYVVKFLNSYLNFLTSLPLSVINIKEFSFTDMIGLYVCCILVCYVIFGWSKSLSLKRYINELIKPIPFQKKKKNWFMW